MTPCPPPEALRTLLTDAPGGPGAETLAAHVETCTRCQHQLEAWTSAANRSGIHRVPDDTPEPPAGFLERLEHLSPRQLNSSPGTEPPGNGRDGVRAEEHGPRVAGYEILGELGRGAMGVVYRARHLGLNRLVALKMILEETHASPEQRARFRREAEALARLQHPNIVQVYDVGEGEGRPFLALELVDGGSLARRLDGTPLDPGTAARVVETLARAVHAAHQCGVVHRDLKPANVLLASVVRSPSSGAKAEEPSATHYGLRTTDHGLTPKITDFGLAKHVVGAGHGEPMPRPDGSLTHSGAIVGSPSYMAPEQAQAGPWPVGPAADIYALGAILYELLTGRPPFRAPTPLDTVLQVLHQEPVAPRRFQPKLPRDLETVCLKCLDKEPARRYATAEALADDLRRFRAGEPITARPAGAAERAWKWARRRPAVAGLTGFSVLAVLGLLVVSLVYGAWLRDALRQTQVQKERSDAQYRQASAAMRQVIDYLQEQPTSMTPELREFKEAILGQWLAFYGGLPKDETSPDPAVRYAAAEVYGQTATVQLQLGRPGPAEENLRRGLRLLQDLCAKYPDVEKYRVERATRLGHLGLAYFQAGRRDAARLAFEEAASLLEPLVHDHPDAYAVSFAGLTSNWSMLLRHAGESEAAVTLNTRVITLVRPVVQKAPDHPRARRVLLNAYGERAYAYQLLGRHAEAVGDWERVLELEHGPRRDFRRSEYAIELARAGWHARAAAEAQALEKAAKITEDTRYNIACAYAQCSRAAARDEQLPAEERARSAEDYGARGVATLARVQTTISFNAPTFRNHVLTDTDLDPLRKREDFQELLRTTEKTPPRP